MSRYIEKFRNFQKAIRQNNGIISSYLQLFRTDDLKWGILVGTDKFGNKYYQNKYYFMGRSRWVDYSPKFGWDYDGSQIPGEWHRWLHYTTDETPIAAPPVIREWMSDHEENYSGTSKQYVPYSTTRTKIEAWRPGGKL